MATARAVYASGTQNHYPLAHVLLARKIESDGSLSAPFQTIDNREIGYWGLSTDTGGNYLFGLRSEEPTDVRGIDALPLAADGTIGNVAVSWNFPDPPFDPRTRFVGRTANFVAVKPRGTQQLLWIETQTTEYGQDEYDVVGIYDELYAVAFDPQAGTMITEQRLNTPAPAFIAWFAWATTASDNLYFANWRTGIYRYDGSDWRSACPVDDCRFVQGISSTSDGRIVIAAQAESITSFRVGLDGNLTAINSIPVAAGSSAWRVLLSPDNRYVFVQSFATNQSPGSYLAFRLTPAGQLQGPLATSPAIIQATAAEPGITQR